MTVFLLSFCSLDEGDDPFKDESCWKKANPSLGHTFEESYLREQVTQARGMPSKESIVRRLNFCQWVDAANPWMSSDVWMGCEESFEPDELEGEECYGGLDLSGSRDLTALALFFPKQRKLLGGVLDPKDTLLERAKTDRVPYDSWERDGHIQPHLAKQWKYGFVAQRIADLTQKFDIKAIAFDQYRIKYLEPELEEASVSVPLIPHGQGYYKAKDSGLWMLTRSNCSRSCSMTASLLSGQTLAFAGMQRQQLRRLIRKKTEYLQRKRVQDASTAFVAGAMAIGASEGYEDDSGDIDDFFSNPINSVSHHE
ncbi:Phage terminase-like protein, large subunit [Raoultella planticola]|nr:Phage terminase-like protein, large subunit [Raoultella planticola]